MLSQFDNALLASVFLWAENRVANKMQAYINTGGQLYYAPDPRLPPALIAYGSPWKQWVYDSGVSGAQILQSVQTPSGTIDRSSGLIVDYINGRVLLPSGMGSGLNLTGSWAVHEINHYLPNETEEQILTQTDRYYFNPRFVGQATGAVPPYSFVTPCTFLNTLHSVNKPFSFGGMNDSTTTVSFAIFAETTFQLTALLSSFRDARYQYIPLLTVYQDPLNQWGDTYSGYNYNAYIAQYGTPGNLVYVEDCQTAKVSDRVKMNPQYFIGLADLTLSYPRLST